MFASFVPLAGRAQFSASEVYTKQFRNPLGVTDTALEKLKAGRTTPSSGQDQQAFETAVDPNLYKLGPGDGLYLNVYSLHMLDQDLVVAPEGNLIIPGLGQVDVHGLTVKEAEAKVNEFLSKSYRSPNAALSIRRVRAFKVNVLGEVALAGIQTSSGMPRVSEVVEKAGGFKVTSSLRNIEVRTATGTLRTHADLVKYFSSGDLASNPFVEGGDVIVVPRVTHTVTIYGSLVAPGQFDFVEGDKLSTLIALSRGLLPTAKTDSVEIARFSNDDPSVAHVMYVDYARGDDVELRDGDAINIRSVPRYRIPRVVSVSGEVEYPGRYSIEVGQTRLLDVVKRAGWVLPTASLDEAVVIRRVGIANIDQDPEFVRLLTFGTTNKDRMTDEEYNYMVARLKQGSHSSMVVDFKKLIEKGDLSENILLTEEDSISFPRARGYVSVTGSVNNQGNVVFVDGEDFNYYIVKAGGFTPTADHSAVRVINSRTNSFIDPHSVRDYKIGPGDTIVIPGSQSTFWKDLGTVTQLVAQFISIVAAVYVLSKK